MAVAQQNGIFAARGGARFWLPAGYLPAHAYVHTARLAAANVKNGGRRQSRRGNERARAFGEQLAPLEAASATLL